METLTAQVDKLHRALTDLTNVVQQLALPHVTVEYGTCDNPVYQVGRKSFVFFRNPRPHAVDPDSGSPIRM